MAEYRDPRDWIHPETGEVFVPKEDLENFWSKVQKGGSTECWLWRGGKHIFGHGRFYMPSTRRMKAAHRFAWETTIGPVPEGLFVLHRCDIPGCVNPDHLFLGTQADNIRDRDRKQRQARGSRQGSAKLTEKLVREIRSLGDAGWLQKDIAPAYGIHKSCVQGICARTTWRHLDG